MGGKPDGMCVRVPCSESIFTCPGLSLRLTTCVILKLKHWNTESSHPPSPFLMCTHTHTCMHASTNTYLLPLKFFLLHYCVRVLVTFCYCSSNIVSLWHFFLLTILNSSIADLSPGLPSMSGSYRRLQVRENWLLLCCSSECFCLFANKTDNALLWIPWNCTILSLHFPKG